MTRILIADPNPASRKAFALLLNRKLGIVDIADVQDVESLIRALTETTVDLLLLDWRLYGAPAPETCRLLKKAYPKLKVVLLSVNTDDEKIATSAGATFIHKGASPEDVLATLHQVLLAFAGNAG